MKDSFLFLVLLILFNTPSVHCTEQNGDKILVAVSIPPQAFFAEKIGGARIKVTTLTQPNDNPAVYEPKPSQMEAISKASVYFTIGVPFEKPWLDKISTLNKNMLVVNSDKNIKKIIMKNHSCYKNCCDNIRMKISRDPHVWTSPPLVKIIAKNMANALAKIDPINKNFYLSNFKKFEIEIDLLHEEIKNLVKNKKEGSEFMVFHPSWGYFANTYGLTQTAIEIEGKEPKLAKLVELIRYAKKKEIKAIFVQPQFSQASAKIIADAINCKILFADPLKYDWLNNTKNQAIQFSMILQ